ncbi:1-acyl-sn-glycerol-3-phosphate acyltransferase [Arenimonas fontis]|uniref:Acyltransferase n=1 Tax=Arenimonas fontis TaxID=2608255 RepID=A0A5B2ZAY7_9GAMM|nr:1-acyl-sn-glycerol-3-phosphate acyltransferase [Arenimonas fontis]KAA2284292.1 acyltransferase [Arenimonas fontis]
MLPSLPPGAPRTGNAFGRWFGRSLLRLGGWRVRGEFPDLERMVIIVAPHSSGWDAVWGLAAKLALGLDIRFMAKAELFRGPLGWLLRRLGGIPVDRQAPGGIVEQSIARLREAGRLWFLLAPEGTRKRVERWKTGFWKIARGAGVPVLCAAFHYPERSIELVTVFQPGEDLEADMAAIRGIYRPFVGKNRGTT